MKALKPERDWNTSTGQKDLMANKRAVKYVTAADFCRIFAEEMTALYSLALLLTAHHQKAEQCFAAALEDCVKGSPVFADWARSWSKRAVIKNATRMIAPVRSQTNGSAEVSDNAIASSGVHLSAARVMRLRPFERFVFVMAVLEGYSDQECAALLNCAPQDIAGARTRALQRIGAVGERFPLDVAHLQPSNVASYAGAEVA